MKHSWIERAATTALTGLAVFGFASAAFAGNYFFEPDLSGSERLIENLFLIGGSLHLDHELCESGILGAAGRGTKEVVLCVRNHQGNIGELHDTIRHEVVHVAQGCKAERLGVERVALRPELAIFYQGYARDYLGWNRLGYNMDRWTTEAEARVLATVMDQHGIVGLLLEECS